MRGRVWHNCLWFVLTVQSAALAPPALAAKLTAKERTHIEEPRPPDVPSDAVLEAAGAIIGKIDIDTRNIFDKDDPRENSGIYRLGNHLHIRTKHATHPRAASVQKRRSVQRPEAR